MEFYENIIANEGNGKPPHKLHFPSKNSEPCLWFLLRSKSNMQWNSMKILLPMKATGNHLKLHFPSKNSEPCLWFLLRSKSNMQWNSMKILLPMKATGNHLLKSTSLVKTQSPVSGFCYARNRICNGIL